MMEALSPQGFGQSEKAEAREAQDQWDVAAITLGVLAAAAVVAFPPAAPGLGLAGALAPLLKRPFARIARDPPRSDFYSSSSPRPPAADPSLAVGQLFTLSD